MVFRWIPRCDYTKSDWEMWTVVVLDDNEEYESRSSIPCGKALCSLDRRAPVPGLVSHETPKAEGFRTVPFRTFHSSVELVKDKCF